MSTRCQVNVRGGLNNDNVTLYHHCDGYPEYMIPVIHKAFHSLEDKGYPHWQLARGGKSASILCSADPLEFEVEQGNHLHGDIEFLYVITVSNETTPVWDVRVYSVSDIWDQLIELTTMPIDIQLKPYDFKLIEHDHIDKLFESYPNVYKV